MFRTSLTFVAACIFITTCNSVMIEATELPDANSVAYHLARDRKPSGYVKRMKNRKSNSVGEDSDVRVGSSRYRKYSDNAKINRIRRGVIQYRNSFIKNNEPTQLMKLEESNGPALLQ